MCMVSYLRVKEITIILEDPHRVQKNNEDRILFTLTDIPQDANV